MWGGIFVRAGTPKTSVTRLNSEFRKVLLDPRVKSGLDKMAIEPLGNSPEEAAAFVSKEYEKWGRVIREADIKTE